MLHRHGEGVGVVSDVTQSGQDKDPDLVAQRGDADVVLVVLTEGKPQTATVRVERGVSAGTQGAPAGLLLGAADLDRAEQQGPPMVLFTDVEPVGGAVAPVVGVDGHEHDPSSTGS